MTQRTAHRKGLPDAPVVTDSLRVDSLRIDRWLNAARIFSSRTDATKACEGGHVRVNGILAKSSHQVRRGDEVTARAPRGHVVLIILELSARRLSPKLARALYDDRSPPPPPKEVEHGERDRGSGRPTKRDRRKLAQLRGE